LRDACQGYRTLFYRNGGEWVNPVARKRLKPLKIATVDGTAEAVP
jgi:hypothetical protein